MKIDSIRLALFLKVLNNMMAFAAADCGNASLHGLTNEKYYIIAASEFGGFEGHIFLKVGSLYRLKPA